MFRFTAPELSFIKPIGQTVILASLDLPFNIIYKVSDSICSMSLSEDVSVQSWKYRYKVEQIGNIPKKTSKIVL